MNFDSDTVDRIRRVLKSARRLQRDAKLLMENGRFPTGFALALIGVEEIGKILLDLWSQETWWERPLPERSGAGMSFHTRKQIAFATLVFGGEIIGEVRQYSEPLTADAFRALYGEAIDRGNNSFLLAEAILGFLSLTKERALYADTEGDLGHVAQEQDVRRILDLHAAGLRLLPDWQIVGFARETYIHMLTLVDTSLKSQIRDVRKANRKDAR